MSREAKYGGRFGPTLKARVSARRAAEVDRLRRRRSLTRTDVLREALALWIEQEETERKLVEMGYSLGA